MFHSALLALSKCLRRRNKRLCFPTTTCIKSSNLSRENKKKKRVNYIMTWGLSTCSKENIWKLSSLSLTEVISKREGTKKNYSKLCSRHDEIRPHLVLHNDNRIWFPITKESVNSHRCIQRCKLLKFYKLKHINKSSEILLYHQATVKE